MIIHNCANYEEVTSNFTKIHIILPLPLTPYMSLLSRKTTLARLGLPLIFSGFEAKLSVETPAMESPPPFLSTALS